MKSFRLFIGNIPAQTSEQELSSEFSAYGHVKNIEIKSKGDDNIFAFINLETEEHIVNQCIREFSEQKYKGVFLNVSKAKESFLDRLKREREEAERKKAQKQQEPAENRYLQTNQSNQAELPKFNIDDKAIGSDSEDDEPPILQSHTPKTLQPQEFDEIVKKFSTNKRKFNESAPVAAVKPPKILDADEEKRLKGLDTIKSTYETQKRLIQSALSSTDGNGSNKKIRFDRGDNEDGGNRLTLFDDDEEDNDLVTDKKMFEVKKQFQGEQGEELFQLQARFKHDSRFVMGPEFLNDSGNQQTGETGKKKQKLTASEKEREAQLRLLKEMGANVNDQHFGKDKQKTPMIRFDPSKADHGKYKKTNETGPEGTTKNNTGREEFQVSNERYVKVNTDLKQALQHSGEFSLLQMFGQAPAATIESQIGQDEDQATPFPGRKFHYDSSDGEEGDEDPMVAKTPSTQDVKKRKAKIFHQKFFFYLDDERLKEGLMFFTAKSERKNPDQVAEARKNLKQIVKQKIKKSNQMQMRKELHLASFKKTFKSRKPGNLRNKKK